MPELDFMVLADYVRTDAGTMHIMGAGIDTITAAAVPTIYPAALAIRITFDSADEPGTEHKLTLIFQGSDSVLATVNGHFRTPPKIENVPIHWHTGVGIALKSGLPLPRYGDYALELAIDDKHVKTINLRVIPVETVES